MSYHLETKRLILREFHMDDDQNMFLLNEDTEVLKYTGDQAFANVEAGREFLKNYLKKNAAGLRRFSVINKENNEWIGWCGLKRNEEDEVDLGFRFYQKEWNKGYATEAAEACLKFGFEVLGLRRIVGRAHQKNLASIKVLEKIGMSFWKKNNEWLNYKIAQSQ